MTKPTDIHITGTELYFLPVKSRLPLKFGSETPRQTDGGICIRVKVKVSDAKGKTAAGWGETPLAVLWSWPSSMLPGQRAAVMKEFCHRLTEAWSGFNQSGHPLEIGYGFLKEEMPSLLKALNHGRKGEEPMPWLAGLVCNSAFDVALHDAYGILHDMPTYETYNPRYMNKDLSAYLTPAENAKVNFYRKYPEDYLVRPRVSQVTAWHLVGGFDLLESSELTGKEPNDGLPVLLSDWIKQDGLKCLKIKLCGNDMQWDYARLVKVAQMPEALGVIWLTADFNCTVSDTQYVNAILDRLMIENPRAYQMILYVEQPFPYDLEKNQIDVHSVSARKPLFMDESAHDWRLVKLGHSLGWTGVALKTCKTQTNALLTLCWAKAHGMVLMVQDLTNPMLAQIPHVSLSAYAGTIMGVETNSMQFHAADTSAPEAEIHPGLYRRKNGVLDLSTVSGPGMGYRIKEIKRQLPSPVASHGL